MVRLISRQRGGLVALKLTKLFGIDDFPAAKDAGKVLIIIIYCYLIIIIINIICIWHLRSLQNYGRLNKNQSKECKQKRSFDFDHDVPINQHWSNILWLSQGTFSVRKLWARALKLEHCLYDHGISHWIYSQSCLGNFIWIHLYWGPIESSRWQVFIRITYTDKYAVYYSMGIQQTHALINFTTFLRICH